jgi:CxxC-x17-CxxC domain-containing protein
MDPWGFGVSDDNLYVYRWLLTCVNWKFIFFNYPLKIIEVNLMSQKTMFEAKCNSCGKTAMVPFKPTPGKPVYCRECFSNRSSKQQTSGNGNSNFEPKQAWARRRDSGQQQKVEVSTHVFQKFSHAPE